MSEQDNGVPSASPTQQNFVPKERLDELIAQRNAAAQQNQVLQEILRKVVPGQQRAPEQEPEYLLKLKEENPVAYQAYKALEAKNKQQGAHMFQVMDNQDRLQFLTEFGDEAKKYANQVEAKLDELRQQGIHHWNRGQILVHLKGQEALAGAKAPKAPTAPVVEAPPPAQANIPSSNPSSASTTIGGSAAPIGKAATIEELEDRLKDVLL